LPNGGDVIDVDAELNHDYFFSCWKIFNRSLTSKNHETPISPLPQKGLSS